MEILCKKKILVKIDKSKYQLKNTKSTIPSIQDEYNLPCKYPEEAEKAAQKIPNHITLTEISNREDFRETLTFTIDPQNAKDFDDALSIKKLSNNFYEIGVHIADVTHYIKPDSSIDKEALKRGTSIYLVDKVIPMLPESLCNEVCSLRPNEDKLCFSVIFEMDGKAKIHNYRIRRTIIRSDHRFTYEEAQEIIERSFATNYEDCSLNSSVFTLNCLAKILREKRFSNGSIDFVQREIQFDLDREGNPLDIYLKKNNEANQLVEEFMLLANKTIAEIVGKVPKNKRAKPFVYRVHGLPDIEKIKNLKQLVRSFGYKLNIKRINNETSKNISSLFKQVQGTREQNLIETIALRTMEKAIYTTENVGHYGLAFKYYTHFTSPIRRYPDMIVHRLLEKYLNRKYSVSKKSLERLCKHCSEQESIAIQAERASIKAKQVEFMSTKVGNTFDGVISNVTEWGLYVELGNGCEGLIPMRYLDDDFYELDEKTYRLIGKTKKHIYCLGDPLQIRVIHSNLEKRQLDFAPISFKK